ncbi:MAG: SDR family oxidoreductase [Myxococcales bacterium]|nr:SDR family oxidoreductase [Myxococcales bacterium]
MSDFPRTGIVTGASRGMGAVIAEALARRGTALVLAARDAAGLAETEALRRARPSGARGPDRRGRPAPARRWSPPPPTGSATSICCSTTPASRRSASSRTLSPEEIELHTRVNLIAPMQLARAVLPGMLARDRGHIVNMASVAGLAPMGFGETYGATKAGLINFSRSLRASLRARHQVRVSAICPGFVEGTGVCADQQVSTASRRRAWSARPTSTRSCAR